MSWAFTSWAGSRMTRGPLIAVFAFALFASASPVSTPASAQNVTASVKGEVTAASGAPIGSGGGVRAGDTIKTGPNSSVTLMLKDRTAFTVGENASIKVNGTASGIGGTGFDVGKGGFRLITGEQDPTTYRIKTPQATLGVRGTIIEGFVDADLGIEVFVLVEGAFQVTTAQGIVTIDRPGNYIVVSEGGKVSPPEPWRGELLSFGASVNLSQAYIEALQLHGLDVLPRFNDFNAGFKARTYDSRFPALTHGGHGRGPHGGGGESGERHHHRHDFWERVSHHGHDHRDKGHKNDHGDHRRDRDHDRDDKDHRSGHGDQRHDRDHERDRDDKDHTDDHDDRRHGQDQTSNDHKSGDAVHRPPCTGECNPE